MSTQTGIVIRIENGWAWVSTRRTGECCAHKDHFQMIEGLDLMEVKAKNAANAKVGDQVQLTLNTKAKMKGMFVLYIFPVLGLLVGAFSAGGLSEVLGLSNSTGLVLFTLCGLILAVLLARFVGNRMEARHELTPWVSRVLKRSRSGVSHFQARPSGCPCGLSNGMKFS